MQLTVSLLKADVGAVGSHTFPSPEMMAAVKRVLQAAKEKGLIIDYDIFHVGDDIFLVISHTHGPLNEIVHKQVALTAFQEATAVAKRQGLYGPGQDLLKEASSGNLRGAGPGVAELTFAHDLRNSRIRPAESFIAFGMDKCGPGAFNRSLYHAFADPCYCSGLMLQPSMRRGFRFRIVDMNETNCDSYIDLDAPEQLYDLAVLLRDNERYGIGGIWSREYPDEQVVAVSTDRLHNIKGTYTGKDDPGALVRIQGFCPAAEEAVSPWTTAAYVGGGARGGHNMPVMPVPTNTAVTGAYCLPLVAARGFSVAADGTFAPDKADFFANPAWDDARLLAQHKAKLMREQGFFGPAMLGESELEYGGVAKTLAELRGKFSRSQPEEIVEDEPLVAEVTVSS